ncbi:MAG: hypothetical protein K2X27_27305 [Candidatus Obscuribacterales bacterium]|nr:hypothetical protein [Candidatus Obscuribacterales bacterium]
MRRRSLRAASDEERQKQNKATVSLKQAFKHELRPSEYLFRVWLTSILSGAYFAYSSASVSGQFDAKLLIPFGGWHAHNPSGGLYMETWGTILVDSLQAGFGLWGAVLIFLGLYRVFSAHKYVFACFYLGIAFLGFVLVLPNWTQILLGMLVEKCPLLVQ